MKNILRKVILPVMLLAMTFILAGCNVKIHYTVDTQGDIVADVKTSFSLEEYLDYATAVTSDENPIDYSVLAQTEAYRNIFEASLETMEGYEGKEVGDDGITYYTILLGSDLAIVNLSTEFDISPSQFVYNPLIADYEEYYQTSGLKDQNVSEEEFYEMLQQMKFTYEVTMPYEVVLTNGELSQDKKTVSFDYDNFVEKSYYAYTDNATNRITLDGTFDNKYTRSKELTVVCDEKVKSVTVNGVEQTSETIKVKKDGSYDIKVVTEKSEKSFNIIRDTKVPKIKGVKNNTSYDKSVKIKFSDKGSGISSATLNGEKIKSKTTVKKNGEYTLVVTDNVGNTKTINFTINK